MTLIQIKVLILILNLRVLVFHVLIRQTNLKTEFLTCKTSYITINKAAKGFRSLLDLRVRD